MSSIYRAIEAATSGQIYLGVGAVDQQFDSQVQTGYLKALIDYGYLDQHLKKQFFDLWLSDEDFVSPDLEDPDIAEQYTLLTKYAAMDPVIEMPKLH